MMLPFTMNDVPVYDVTSLPLFAIGVLIHVVILMKRNIFCKQASQAIYNAPIPRLKSLDGIAFVQVYIICRKMFIPFGSL